MIGGYVIFGSFGSKGGPLGTGQRAVTAQASLVLQGTQLTLTPGKGGEGQFSATPPPPPSAEFLKGIEAREELNERGMEARAQALPASDSRVQAGPPPAAETETRIRGTRTPGGMGIPPASGPGQMADNTFTYFRASTFAPPAGYGSVVNEPAVAQNGKDVFMSWNWFAARSGNGGAGFAYVDPWAYAPGMADFCCDQDVIYDKGRDRMFWERLGYLDVDGTANNQNRILINESPDNFSSSCYVDLRGTLFGEANAFLDYPRMSLSDNYLYMTLNIFDFNSGAYRTHLLMRIELTPFATCTAVNITYWKFSDGWSPALVENAREIMYMGDQIITNTGLNDIFRVCWLFDDNVSFSCVDRNIAPFLFTQGNAVCTVNGGTNPCARADHRIIGAVLEHNTPLPGNLGSAGDKVDFFWNVRAGNGFPLPYTESAGFFGNTIAYVQRKLIWSSAWTIFYAAVGANDREHTGLQGLYFAPPGGGDPCEVIGLDDDYNGNPASTGWELYYGYCSSGPWTGSASGDYQRVRSHNPVGVAWAASGYASVGSANNNWPNYVVFGRARDLNGFNRFDQK
jgi:hypothetical protein